MKKFFVEDAAHDAILKILGKPGLEIQISKGRARVITLTLASENPSIGFIDHDNGADGRLMNVTWQSTDDFNHCQVDGKLFIKYQKNVEEWLYRISKECKVDVNDNEIKLSSNPVEWHLNQKINSSSQNARIFLQKILDYKNSPLKLLREVIEGYLA
jgi:hypothetical protein